MAKMTVKVNLVHDGIVTPWELLTAEQITEAQSNMKKKLEKTLSEYFTGHPEELARL